MKRKRFLELTHISVEVMNMLDKKKVTRQERCTVNRICNNINEATYDQDGPERGLDQPTVACEVASC